MQVKAQGLLNAAKWIEEEYGRESLRDILHGCSQAVRDRYTTAIAINWHPVEEFIEFVRVADQHLGRSSGKIAEQIGAAGARANMKGMLVRIAFYITQPEFMMKRVAGMWRQFNDEGVMEVARVDERSGEIVVRGLSEPNPIFCMVLTGWVREVGKAMGIKDPVVRHSACMCKGQDHCVWDVRWAAIRADQHVVPAADAAASSSSSRVRAAIPARSSSSSARLNAAPPARPASSTKTEAAKPIAPSTPPTAPSNPPSAFPSTKRSPK